MPRHADRRRTVERRGAGRGDAGARGRAVPLEVPRSGRRDGQGEGRAGLSDPGDGPGQDAAHEAAEPRDRLADQASGGGHDEHGLAGHIPVGVIVERVKAASQWADYIWRPSACWPASRTRRAMDRAGRRRRTHDILCRAGDRGAASQRDRELSRQSRIRHRRRCGWCCATPAANRPTRSISVTADPAEGEGITEAGNDIVEPVPMPDIVRDAVAAFVAEHHVERLFVKRKRDRADPESLGRGRRGAKGRAMTDRDESAKGFLERWSRKKIAAEREPRAGDRAPRRTAESARPSDRRERIKARPKRQAEFDLASLPSLEFDQCRHRHPRLPAAGRPEGTRSCGPSSRLVGRSRDPRLHRPCRKRVGLQRPDAMPGFGALPPGYGHQEDAGAGLRRSDEAADAVRRQAAEPAAAPRCRSKAPAGDCGEVAATDRRSEPDSMNADPSSRSRKTSLCTRQQYCSANMKSPRGRGPSPRSAPSWRRIASIESAIHSLRLLTLCSLGRLPLH